MNNKINSLETVRCIAFVFVFFQHTPFEALHSAGYCGVSIFFILSGFVFTLNYFEKNRLDTPTIKSSFVFAWTKIKKFYPLHIICLIAMIPFALVGKHTMSIPKLLFLLPFNLTLTQTWLPICDSSIIGVSWYLCSYLLSCILFPWIIKKMEKNTTEKKAISSIIFLFALQFAIAYISKYFPTTEYKENMWLEYNMTQWFSYYFPLSRIVDFIIGCNLSYLFLKRSSNPSKIKCSIMECIGVLLIVIPQVIVYKYRIPSEYGEVTVGQSGNWWIYTIPFTIGSIIFIYSFAINNGILSKCLTGKITIYIARISNYGFITHMVILRYIYAIMVRLPIIGGQNYADKFAGWVEITIGFILTIISVEIWTKIENKIMSKTKISS